MRKFLFVFLLLTLAMMGQARENPQAQQWLSRKGVSFVENKGQVTDSRGAARPDILFTADVNGAKVYFSKGAVSYVFAKLEEQTRSEQRSIKELYRMDLEFVGANPNVTVLSDLETGTRYNYYNTGNANGLTDVRAYRKLIYKNLYNNIDLIFYPAGKDGNGGVKYDFIVHPGGKVSDIRMRHQAATNVRLQGNGSLEATTPLGNVVEDAPYTFIQGNTNQVVASRYLVRNGEISFFVGQYDANQTLVIDPLTTIASTYYGGVNLDQAYGVAFDAAGNATATGYTQSTPFPTTAGAHQGSFGGTNDAFIVQFDNAGRVRWATYYGGTSLDEGRAIGVDASGIVIAGLTASSSGIATPGAAQATISGATDVFVAKFDNTGRRVWGTYYGGSVGDNGFGVAVANTGDIYVTGVTFSNNFPTSGGGVTQAAFGGSRDAFIFKLNSAGALQWSSFYGGAADDRGNAIAVNTANSTVVISGQTSSSNNISTDGSTYAGGTSDMFVASFNASNGSRNFGRYVGSTGADIANGVAIDGSNNIIAVGESAGTPPTNDGSTNKGSTDAYVAKLTSTGSVVWARLIGGASNDIALATTTNAAGTVFVTGRTRSADFPVTAGNGMYMGNDDAFVLQHNGGTGATCESGLYGGSSSDISRAIASNGANTLVIAGSSISTNFPVTAGAAQAQRAGNDDGVIVWLTAADCGGNQGGDFTINVNTTNATCATGGTVTASATPAGSYTYTLSNGTPTNTTGIFTNVSGGTYTVTARNSQGTERTSNSFTVATTGGFNLIGSSTPSTAGGNTGSVNVIASGGRSPYTFTFPGRLPETASFSNTFNNVGAGTYTISAVDANSCTASTTVIVETNQGGGSITIQPTSGNPNDLIICENGSVALRVLNPVAGATYEWLRNGNTRVGTGPSYTIGMGTMGANTGDAGTYSVRQTLNGVVTVSNQLAVIVNPLPSNTTDPSGNASICTQGNGQAFGRICAQAQPNVVYRWFGTYTDVQSGERFTFPTQTDNCITATRVGVYFVEITNTITGCRIVSEAINVSVSPGPAAPVLTVSGNSTVCQGETVVLTRSSVAGVSYQWRRNGEVLAGQSTTNFIASEAGSYDVVARSSNGCIATSNAVTVAFNPAPNATISALGSTTFCNASSVDVSFSAPSGLGNTYTWRINGTEVQRGGNNSFRVQGRAGRVSVTVCNPQGCCAESNVVEILLNNFPEATLSTSGRTSYCAGEAVNLSLTAPFGNGVTYQFLVDGRPIGGPSPVNSINVNQAGCYRVQLSSGVCAATSNEVCVRINPKPTAIVTSTPGQPTIVCEGGRVELFANSSADFTYQWFRDGMMIQGATMSMYTVTEVGTANYSVAISTFGCTSDLSNPVVVTVYPRPVARIETRNNTTNICIGQNLLLDGFDDSHIENGVNVMEYAWRFQGQPIFGANQPTYLATVPGTYVLIVRNRTTGCRETDDLELALQVPPVVSVDATGITTFCEGGSVTLTALPFGADGYRWFNGAEVVAGETGRTIRATESGQYRVEVLVGACAVLSQAVTVNVLPLPSAEISIEGDAIFCSNETVTLRAMPGADTYQWFMSMNANMEPRPIAGATSQTLVVSRMGLYFVRVTKDGCENFSEQPVNLMVNNVPQAVLQPSGETTRCEGQTDLFLSAFPPGAGFVYTWLVGATPETAEVIEGQTQAVYQAVRSGRYWVLISTPNGCSSLSNPIDVRYKPVPSVSTVLVRDSIVCEDGSVEIIATASNFETGAVLEYHWFRNNTRILAADAAGSIYFAKENGMYSVVVIADRCASAPSNPLNVKVQPNPNVAVNLSGPACVGVMITAPVNTGGRLPFLYQWFRNGIRINGAMMNMYTVPTEGNYVVRILNQITGCEEWSEAVTVFPLPIANAGPAVETCAGVPVMLDGSATGGDGNYTYMWMQPAGLTGTLSNSMIADPMVTIGTAGSYVYTLAVTDGRACVSNPVGTVTVLVNPNPVADAGGNTAICQNGQLMLMGNAAGGAGAPYTFMWTGPNNFMASGANPAPVTIDTPGTFEFTLTVQDGNGCIGTDNLSVFVKEDPRIIAVAGNPFPNPTAEFCFGGNLVLESTVRGDLYNWYRDGIFVQGGIDNRYTAFIGGLYTVEVIDVANGITCTSQTPFRVTVYQNPIAEIFPSASIICPLSSVNLQAATAPGNTYLWVIGDNPSVAVPAAGVNNQATYAATIPGRYWVLVTSRDNCQSLSSPRDLTASTLTINGPTPTHPSGCGTNDGSISVMGMSSVFPVQYSINNGPFTSNGMFSGLSNGSYTVAIREVGGCTSTATVNLTVAAPTGLSVDATSITDNSAIVGWNFVGGGGVIRYNLRYRVAAMPMSERWMEIRNINGTAEFLEELQSDTRYEVQVQTVCQSLGIVSEWATTTFSTLAIPGLPCQLPTDVYVNVRTAPDGVPTVYWQNVPGAACYDLQYRTRIPEGNWITLQVLNADNPRRILGLLRATSYEVRMRTHCGACNSGIVSPWSNNIPFDVPGDCDPNFLASINQGVNIVDNCGDYTLSFDGERQANYSFQWRFNGIEIGGATEPTFVATTSGNYDLMVTVGNCEPVFSNAVRTNIRAVPAVIANVSQNVSCINGGDGIITAGCVDVPGRLCRDNQAGYLYKLIGNNGFESDFQVSGVFTSLRPGLYTAVILDLETGCTAIYSEPIYTTVSAPAAASFVRQRTTGLNASSANVEWTSVNGANAYVLSYRPVGAGDQNWMDVFISGGGPFPGTNTFLLTTLQNGTEYEIRVRSRCAQDNVLSDWSDTTQFRTTAFAGCGTGSASDGIPGGIFAVVNSRFTARISFNVVTGAACYQVRFRQLGQGETNWSEVPSTVGTSVEITRLLANTTYEYQVRAICGNNCSGTPGDWSDIRTFKTFFDRTEAGISSTVAEGFRVYPNPNNGSFTVSIDATQAGVAQLEMVDLTGRVVFAQTQDINLGSNELPVTVSGYSAGVYMLNYRQGEVKRVVKVVLN
jgi:hypothetical protein